MKKLLKLTLAVALMLSASSLYAQKFGRVNLNDVLAAMPEAKEAQTNLEAFVKDLSATYETMQVEINTKVADLQKNEATMTESMKQLKYKEIQDLSARMEEYQQSAQNEMQQKRAELLKPVQDKAMAAVDKVSRAGGYLAVFDTAMPSLAYFDETQLVDLLPEVKRELGIQ